jgi:hypothetical protein
MSEHDQFTLEKLKIVEKLIDLEKTMARIEVYVANSKINCSASMDSVAKMLEKHNETLYGNGHDGLTTRMVRTETLEGKRTERENRRLAGMWALFVAVFGLIITQFFKIINKVGN